MAEITDFFKGFDTSVILDKIYFFVGIILFAIIIGALIMGFFILRRKKKIDSDTVKIGWWTEVTGTGQMEPTRMDDATEIVIPGTTLRVFYVKKRDLWLPRFSRGVTSKLFYVLLTPTQQMVNFTLRSLTQEMKEAKLDYDDHTDMLWASENTREYIKTHYKDKSIKWWQVYQGPITVAIYILILTFSFVIIIYFMRGIVEDMGAVASSLADAVDRISRNTATSGVVPA